VNGDASAAWTRDSDALAELGRALVPQDLTVTVRLPGDLARRAVTAWNRDDSATQPSEETPGQSAARKRAAALALIGLAVQQSGNFVAPTRPDTSRAAASSRSRTDTLELRAPWTCRPYGDRGSRSQAPRPPALRLPLPALPGARIPCTTYALRSPTGDNGDQLSEIDARPANLSVTPGPLGAPDGGVAATRLLPHSAADPDKERTGPDGSMPLTCANAPRRHGLSPPETALP
jgi:hypothetical protein